LRCFYYDCVDWRRLVMAVDGRTLGLRGGDFDRVRGIIMIREGKEDS
jgi:hypothetical protein